MFKLNYKIPKDVAIAVSGGADSMAALDFLRKNRNITVLHYNHGTGEFADDAERLVKAYCQQYSLEFYVGHNTEEMPAGVSAEAWWREKRYTWFDQITSLPIITAHHLDDVAETWLFTSMHGYPKLIPSLRGKYIRPFLTTRKEVFENWCLRKCVPYIEDPSNTDVSYMRNYIRNIMMPHALSINPGFHKVLKKNILSTDQFS